MSGPQTYVPVYVNDDGDMWIERGVVPWPRVLHEAADMARTIGEPDSVALYEGIVEDVRVSDERECPHMDDDGCGGEECCRTISAYAFHSAEPKAYREA